MNKHIASPTIETLWLNMNAECDWLWLHKDQLIAEAVALGLTEHEAIDSFLDEVDMAESPYRVATNEGNKL